MKNTTDTLQVSIDYIKDMVEEIKKDIKEIKTQYATKAELAEVKEELSKRIDPLSNTFTFVGFAILSVAIGAFVYIVATHPLSLIKG